MGVLGLSRLIADSAPEAIKEVELKSLFGRRIAIDASMSIYQFLIAIRNRDQLMTNESGETTSHLIGLFYRTIKLLEVFKRKLCPNFKIIINICFAEYRKQMGIKPIYVFDGKAPKLKAGELTKRAERRQEAEARLAEALEQQNVDDISKFNKRVVRVTRKHNDDCKRLLRLLGLPVIESPSEAEAQCAQLCREGLVYATATEDMDALTFGSPRLIRQLTSSKDEKVKEYYLDRVLAGLGLTHAQFTDLAILMGCDYCDSIRGIGGKKGLDLIRKYGSIETILESVYGITEFVKDIDIDYGERQEISIIDEKDVNGDDVKQEDVKDEVNGSQDVEDIHEDIRVVDNSQDVVESQTVNDSESDDNDSKINEETNKKKDKKKKTKDKKAAVPENWLFIGARKLFVEPNVKRNTIQESDLKQKDADEEEIVKFLCVENGFNEDRVRSALKRVKDTKGKCSQTRIDTFFKTMPNNVKNDKSQDSKTNKRGTPQAKSTASKRGRKAK